MIKTFTNEEKKIKMTEVKGCVRGISMSPSVDSLFLIRTIARSYRSTDSSRGGSASLASCSVC